MPRRSAKLNALAAQRARRPGLFSDGAGLYLRVSRAETKSWVFRFMLNGRAREMGLGPFPLISLAGARSKALEARKLLHEGVDPIEVRNASERAQILDAARTLTFDECAARYIEDRRTAWSGKTAGLWETTLATHVSPIFGKVPVREIDTALVRRALDPIWKRIPETAGKVRYRIELILDWATASEYRTGLNPARWRGHLDKLLPKKSLIHREEHHTALAYTDIGDFLESLRSRTGTAPLALEFLILTGCRTSEVLLAQWSEFDLAGRVWIIPAMRMKTKREHRVPISNRAMEILRKAEGADTEYVFPGSRPGKPLSNMAFLEVLRRMEVEVTTHGFRSTFRDWAAEITAFPREVAEQALAHTVSNKVEAAYRRGDLFEKRRKLMDAWSDYCARPTAGTRENVVGIGHRTPA